MRESFTIILFMAMFTFETLKNLNSQMPAMRVMLVMVQILFGIPMHNTTKCFYNYPINLPSNLVCFQLAFW